MEGNDHIWKLEYMKTIKVIVNNIRLNIDACIYIHIFSYYFKNVDRIKIITVIYCRIHNTYSGKKLIIT